MRPQIRAAHPILTLLLVLEAGCTGELAGAAFPPDAGRDAPAELAPEPGPPLDIAGLSLWLDPRTGLEIAGGTVVAWQDRSIHSHRLFPEFAEGNLPPVPAALAGRPALAFDGRNRFYLEAREEGARQAL